MEREDSCLGQRTRRAGPAHKPRSLTSFGMTRLRLDGSGLWRCLSFCDAEALGHFFVEEAFAGAVGLDPFSVNDELGAGGPPLRFGKGGIRVSLPNSANFGVAE